MFNAPCKRPVDGATSDIAAPFAAAACKIRQHQKADTADRAQLPPCANAALSPASRHPAMSDRHPQREERRSDFKSPIWRLEAMSPELRAALDALARARREAPEALKAPQARTFARPSSTFRPRAVRRYWIERDD